MTVRIVRNAARCLKCGTVVESRSVHDFVPCRCGAIFVDGGTHYLRAGGNPSDFESLAITEGVEDELDE
jgi:hypothetical protein